MSSRKRFLIQPDDSKSLQHFDVVEWWEEELTDHMNLLKIEAESCDKDPVLFVRDTIGYEFINENLLRQAFTRRAFAVEYQGSTAYRCGWLL